MTHTYGATATSKREYKIKSFGFGIWLQICNHKYGTVLPSTDQQSDNEARIQKHQVPITCLHSRATQTTNHRCPSRCFKSASRRLLFDNKSKCFLQQHSVLLATRGIKNDDKHSKQQQHFQELINIQVHITLHVLLINSNAMKDGIKKTNCKQFRVRNAEMLPRR